MITDHHAHAFSQDTPMTHSESPKPHSISASIFSVISAGVSVSKNWVRPLNSSVRALHSFPVPTQLEPTLRYSS